VRIARQYWLAASVGASAAGTLLVLMWVCGPDHDLADAGIAALVLVPLVHFVGGLAFEWWSWRSAAVCCLGVALVWLPFVGAWGFGVYLSIVAVIFAAWAAGRAVRLLAKLGWL